MYLENNQYFYANVRKMFGKYRWIIYLKLCVLFLKRLGMNWIVVFGLVFYINFSQIYRSYGEDLGFFD